MDTTSSNPFSVRAMRTRCDQGQARETYKWYRSVSGAYLDPGSGKSYMERYQGII